MRFSLIVPTYNRKNSLRRCLTIATSQEYPDYEVIVVDDASTDGTDEMVRREFPQVRYLRQERNRGPAAARNRGVEAATGEFIAFTDDDCEPPPSWLSVLKAGFESYPEVGAVGGLQEAADPVWQHNRLARYERFLTRRVYGVGELPVLGQPAPGGTNNLAIRRALLQRLGGFDETFPVAAGEDADLLYRLVYLGYPTVCLPIKVTHHQAYTWPGFVRQQVRRGIGAFYFQNKHGCGYPLTREVMRLLATPLLFFRNLYRYRTFEMTLIHTISGALQTWGRIQGRRGLAIQVPEQWWQIAPSPVKLRYLERYAAGRTALDVGSGAGFYARILARRGFRVIAVDLTPHSGKEIPTIQARLSALPLGTRFDTVLCFDVLEHESDEWKALNELRRVVTRRLLLSVPNADHDLLLRYNLTYKHHTDKTHQREYHAEELRHKLEKSGFRVLAIQPEGPVHPAVVAEFIRPSWLRASVRLFLKALHRFRILYNQRLMADLYAVAEPGE
jgi:glycosyltransferase involved in cell wall biosynthesis